MGNGTNCELTWPNRPNGKAQSPSCALTPAAVRASSSSWTMWGWN